MREHRGGPCIVCGFPSFHIHRLIPGYCGGEYTDINVISLCPNHHTLMHACLRGGDHHYRLVVREDATFWALYDSVAPLVRDVRRMDFHEKQEVYWSIQRAAGSFTREVARV